MTEHQHLTYSRYINDRGIRAALRIPQDPPKDQSPETWPVWHERGEKPKYVASTLWEPGEEWPAHWAHHEVLFIRVHQAFEVWFSLILHEIGAVLRSASDFAVLQGGQSLPLIDLSVRQSPGNSPKEYSPLLYPQLDRAIAELGITELVEMLKGVIGAPGRYHVDHALPARDDQLRAWAKGITRASKALRVTIPFFDVLRTMSPKDFFEFRGRLAPASGFGSTQFRELEMRLGLREVNAPRIAPENGDPTLADGQAERLPEGMLRPTQTSPQSALISSFYQNHDPEDWPRLARAFGSPSLRDLVYALLTPDRLHLDTPNDVRNQIDAFAATALRRTFRELAKTKVYDSARAWDLATDLDGVLSHREAIIAARIAMEAPHGRYEAISIFLEACRALDEVMLEWRDSHIRFVEGMIGRQPGTGGTGVNYLRKTVEQGASSYFVAAFPCLAQSRSIVQG